jgi:hypothetical protein
MPAINLFISYSHKEEDKAIKNELARRLHPWELEGKIKIWTDDNVVPGQEWDAEIKGALQQSRVILFLVSKNFLNSRYINDVELKHAVERYNNGELVLIPIMIETIEKEQKEKLGLKKFQDLPEVNKVMVPISAWNPQAGAYDNIMIGLAKSLALVKTPVSEILEKIEKMRKQFRNASYDDVLRELRSMDEYIETHLPDLSNAVSQMIADWRTVKNDKLRGISGADQKHRDFTNTLIDFISQLKTRVLEDQEA